MALMKPEETTGKPTRDIFSFAASPSTGAVVATAIRILDLYLNKTLELFVRSLSTIVKRVLSSYASSTSLWIFPFTATLLNFPPGLSILILIPYFGSEPVSPTRSIRWSGISVK